MDETETLTRLGLSLAIGFLIGVERGWREREEKEGERAAGLRTFALIGLFGGLVGSLSLLSGGALAWIAGLLALTAAFGVWSYRESAAEGDFSVTNLVAAMTVYVLGVTAVIGDPRAAAGAGVVAAALLAGREALHRLVSRLSWIELRSGLLLLAMTAVVLPLLPDRPVDPLGALNPRELWLLMTLTAAVSYCGYVALKVAGPGKGPPIAGLAGGLASSTAVTIAMARLSRSAADARGPGLGAALAAMVSLVRATGLAVALQPSLAPLVAGPALTGALVFGLAGSLPLLRRKAARETSPEIGIPFELSTVLGFGLLLAAVTLAGAWVRQHAGPAGGYAFAAVSGLLDVDAITLSTARSVARGADPAFAARAILAAFAANAFQRAVFAWVFGTRAFALRLSAVTVAALAAAGAALAVQMAV